ncbi:MAG: hypothetical protein IJ828_02775 [Treponema sp.]|nr:hypothetical protein [Treponema sp.]
MKKIVATPFDRNRIPPKQSLFLMPLFWLYMMITLVGSKLKIHKVRMKGLKPPFLVLGTHHSLMDFMVSQAVFFPHRINYVSELEGFEMYGEWLYRKMGCLGTRKFITDFALIRNIQQVIKRKGILVQYPEARYANVGTSSELSPAVGKLAKLLDVPLVILNMRGNYLQSPIWNLAKRKDVYLEATVTQVFTQEELRKASVHEVNKKIAQFMQYDEYKWQWDSRMAITYPKRAEGLEKPLYQCPVCGTSFAMKGQDADLFCTACGASWHKDEYSRLERTDSTTTPYRDTSVDFAHIPNWYEWERAQVMHEIDSGSYFLDIKVHIESLPNAVNFIDCGTGRLCHKEDGCYLTFKDYGHETEETLFFASDTMYSIHTEYDYRNKGQCITLSTLDNTYFIFPLEDGFNATKIQFAVEYLYKKKTALKRHSSSKKIMEGKNDCNNNTKH